MPIHVLEEEIKLNSNLISWIAEYLPLPPTRQDLTQGLFYSGDLGEEEVRHEPKLMICWTIQDIGSIVMEISIINGDNHTPLSHCWSSLPRHNSPFKSFSLKLLSAHCFIIVGLIQYFKNLHYRFPEFEAEFDVYSQLKLEIQFGLIQDEHQIIFWHIWSFILCPL